jgi:cell division septation protein DedD
MTFSRNLSRARSHIIFIIALLSAAAYILWVETSRGRASEAPSAVQQWRVEIGAFDNAQAAGRYWDQMRSGIEEMRQVQVTLVEGPDGVRLRAGPLGNQQEAIRLCAAARQGGGSCAVLSPSL